ncbi:hypothetical protein GFY24_07620 [Nocardia sp. SYP-A9097]|uniref:hypothetical protein n=1 Tax=Nocardia sp. SYP-A9097 TaxID=2663237 RepID=UPI00129ADFA2|nr:hypothetical protein [Nocardia sp. SYP-A9097]MRH87331.1 hypothetical protein [Nocardia sp. SYP-A9097]
MVDIDTPANQDLALALALDSAEKVCGEVTDLCASAGVWLAMGGPVLPDWHELFAALCPERGADPAAHPVAKCARGLAELHTVARRDPGVVGILGMRLALRSAIDLWTLHHARYAYRCGQSLGAVVDAMAAAQLDAVQILRAPAVPPSEALHLVWLQVGELAVRWADLVDHVVHGQALSVQARPRGCVTPGAEARKPTI